MGGFRAACFGRCISGGVVPGIWNGASPPDPRSFGKADLYFDAAVFGATFAGCVRCQRPRIGHPTHDHPFARHAGAINHVVGHSGSTG